MQKRDTIFKTSNVQFHYDNMDWRPMFAAGFKPIAYSIMMLEDTFYFETVEEAKRAYEYFEGGDSATKEYVGWWYSIDEVEVNNKYCLEELGESKIPKLIKIVQT